MLRFGLGLGRFAFGLVLLVWAGDKLDRWGDVGVYLVGCVASHGAVGTLGCASGRVDVRANGGRVVVVGHGGSRWYALMDELVAVRDEAWI